MDGSSALVYAVQHIVVSEPDSMNILIALHVLAALIWVGGMFFLLLMVRPAAGALPVGDRLPLFSKILGRFFLWVWLSVIVLVISGYAMIAMLGGMAAVPVYVDIMQGLGWIMMLMFGHIFFSPWRRMRTALNAGALADAGRALNQIRMLASVALVLGLIVVALAAGGRYGWF